MRRSRQRRGAAVCVEPRSGKTVAPTGRLGSRYRHATDRLSAGRCIECGAADGPRLAAPPDRVDRPATQDHSHLGADRDCPAQTLQLIDSLNEFVGRWVAWLVLLAVLISAGNAVVRKAFNISSNAFLEIQWYLFAAVFLLGRRLHAAAPGAREDRRGPRPLHPAHAGQDRDLRHRLSSCSRSSSR